MARFGRSTPPSTRLRAPIRPDGPPPHVYTPGVAGEQTSARPVNRAVGEVRQAPEQDVALAVGRTHARTPGQAVQADSARAIAGRAHRRDLGRAGEQTTGNAVRRGHRRDTGRAPEYSSARSVLGDRPNVTPQAWAAAIESDDRTPIMRLQADWSRTGQFDHAKSDLTGLVKTVTVDRSLKTNLPANVGIVEGSAASSLTAELGGEWPDGTTPTQAFAPYRTDATFYAKPVIGTPVSLDTGFVTEQGAKTERRFTGSVRRVASQSRDRKVTLDALDGANELRAPITLGAAGLDGVTLARYGISRYFARINSQWLIDYIARCNGVFSSPPPPPGTVLSATMHGSTIPEIGYGGTPLVYGVSRPSLQAWTKNGHPFGMLFPDQAAPPITGSWYSDGTLSCLAGNGFGLAFWAYVTPSVNVDVPITIRVGTNFTGGIQFSSGRAYQFATTSPEVAQAHALPAVTTPQWMYVGAHFQFTASATILTLRWQGQTTTTSGGANTSGAVEQNPKITFGSNQRAFSNVVIWNAASPPLPTAWPGETWKSEADIDPGMGEWWGIPAIDGEDSWSLLTEVVGAEFGTCGFTPSGRFYFRARGQDHARPEPEEITARKSLADLASTVDEASVRNVVTGTAAAYLIGDWETVYEPSDPAELDCGPGVTDFYVPVAEGTTEVWSADAGGRFLYSPDATFDADAALYTQRADIIYFNVYSDDPTTAVASGAFKVAAKLLPGNQMRLTFYNNTGRSVRFSQPTSTDSDGTVRQGRPAFRLPGRRLKPQTSEVVAIADPGSVVDYGERSYDLGGQSRWRQHPPSVAAIASSVLSSLGRPAPVLEDVEVPHDPRRGLFAPVSVSDPEGLGTVLGTITGIKTTYSASGAVDSLTVRPIGPPGLGVMDDADLGQVGATLVFGT